jgi:hypothetical protein
MAAIRSRLMVLALIGLGSSALFGCRYERVISQRNILSGVQGAESSIPPKKQGNTKPVVFAVPEGGIRQVDEQGNVTLYEAVVCGSDSLEGDEGRVL